jgi:hypothetical protein
VLNIHSHRNGAGNVLKVATFPELGPESVIVGDQDDEAFDSGFAQALEAFVEQTLANPGSPIGRVNGQMVYVSATAVVTTEHDADHCLFVGGHAAQPSIARDKLSDAFPVVPFSDLQAFDTLPKLKGRLIIINAKLSSLDAIHVVLAWFTLIGQIPI